MPDRYCFRQRFEVAPGGRLPFTDDVVTISTADDVSIELRSLESKAIAESTKIALWGSGYASEAEARAGGELWRSAAQRALAGVGLGANFGLRNPNMGGLVDSVLEEMKRDTGVTVYPDSWDILVFPCEPRPLFSSMTADGYVTPQENAVRAAFDASGTSHEAANEVAFDLFAASMRSAHMADVRVVLLVMAIECLIARARRPEATVAHIESLVEATLRNDALDADDREALANALRSLRYESTTKAAKVLAQQLDPSHYADDPTSLIPEAFKMRHALVHGHGRPDLGRVRYVGANLEKMVGNLIAGPSVTASVAAAPLDLK